jgi:hypothetical protein
MVGLFTSGSVAGVVSWTMCYPLDIIKTRIQCLPQDTPVADRQIRHIHRILVKEHGYRIYSRGLLSCLARSVPVNGFTFVGYEYTMGLLKYSVDGDDSFWR